MLNDTVQPEEESNVVANESIPAWHAWLPAPAQLRAALLLDLGVAIDGEQAPEPDLAEVSATSMRQGGGLIVVGGLVAGFIPFLADLIGALQANTLWGSPQIAEGLSWMGQSGADVTLLKNVTEVVATFAGLEPIAPTWLVALLIALGGWLNWPMRWLTTWIVYGIGVLIIAKLLGTPTTLQRFYAGISYAYLPLILLGLTPIPYVGPLLALVGLLWAFLVYVRAVGVVARFSTLRALIAVVTPFVIAFVIAMAVAAAGAMAIVQLVM